MDRSCLASPATARRPLRDSELTENGPDPLCPGLAHFPDGARRSSCTCAPSASSGAFEVRLSMPDGPEQQTVTWSARRQKGAAPAIAANCYSERWELCAKR